MESSNMKIISDPSKNPGITLQCQLPCPLSTPPCTSKSPDKASNWTTKFFPLCWPRIKACFFIIQGWYSKRPYLSSLFLCTLSYHGCHPKLHLCICISISICIYAGNCICKSQNHRELACVLTQAATLSAQNPSKHPFLNVSRENKWNIFVS